MQRVCDGNAMYANDLLMADPAARDLYRLATREAAVRVAKIVKKPSVSPTFAWQYIKGMKEAA